MVDNKFTGIHIMDFHPLAGLASFSLQLDTSFKSSAAEGRKEVREGGRKEGRKERRERGREEKRGKQSTEQTIYDASQTPLQIFKIQVYEILKLEGPIFQP